MPTFCQNLLYKKKPNKLKYFGVRLTDGPNCKINVRISQKMLKFVKAPFSLNSLMGGGGISTFCTLNPATDNNGDVGGHGKSPKGS